METKVENAIINFNPNTTLDENPQPKAIIKNKRSKNFFKVALFMMRGHSRKSSKAILPVDDESKSMWRKLVGSMRPMHLQSNKSPPQILNGQNNLKHVKVVVETANDHEREEDGFHHLAYTPSPASSRHTSAASSRYASAVGLNEMVEEEKEEEIVNKGSENYGDDGDDMIDAKADEFIAHFYQEMRLQRMDVVDHRYNELSMRSLGL